MMLRLLRSPLLVALAAQSIGWLLAFAAARLGLVAGPSLLTKGHSLI